MKDFWMNLTRRLAGPSLLERVPRELRTAENLLLDAQLAIPLARLKVEQAQCELREAEAELAARIAIRDMLKPQVE